MHNAFKILASTSLITAIFFFPSASQAAMSTKKYGTSYKLKSNVTYLPDPSRMEKADLYIPKGNINNTLMKRAAMVVIHGGRFEKGDKADARERISGKLLA